MGCCHSTSDSPDGPGGVAVVDHRVQPGAARKASKAYDDDSVQLTFDFGDCQMVEQSFKAEERRRSAAEQELRRALEMEEQRRRELSRSRMDDQEVQWQAHEEDMQREQAQIRAESERAQHEDTNVLQI